MLPLPLRSNENPYAMDASPVIPHINAFSIRPTFVQATNFITPAKPTAPRDLYMVVELSGNGLTFEIRDAQSPMESLGKKDPLLPYFEDISDDHANSKRRYRQKILLNNSQEISETGAISDETVDLILKQLHHIREVHNDLAAQGHKISLKAIGTAPLRSASNSWELRQRIENEAGFIFNVADDDTEAYYTAMGVIGFFPDTSGVIVDMGGGSTEFILLENGSIKKTASIPFGSSNIRGSNGDFDAALDGLDPEFFETDYLLPSGGTLRNVNKSFAAQEGHDTKESPPPAVSMDDYKDHLEFITNFNDKEWEKAPESLRMRQEKIPAGLTLIKKLSKRMQAEDLQVALTKTKTRDGIFANMYMKEHIWPRIQKTLHAQSSTSLYAVTAAIR